MTDAATGGADASAVPAAAPAAAPAPAAAAPLSAAAALLAGGPAPAAPAAPAAAAPAAAAPAAPAEGKSFLDGIEGLPDEVRTWATAKGFPSLKDAIEAGFQAEKLVGADQIPLPKDENDKEGLDRAYKALGRPDDAKAYGLDKIEGADPEFAGAMGAAFLEAGLNPAQAQKLAAANQAFAAAAEAKAQETFQAESTRGVEELAKEWGKDFDARIELGRRAARQFGLADYVPQLEKALGSKNMLTFLHKVGSTTGEAVFEEGESKPGFSLSQDQAKARINTLKTDQEFGRKLTAGDATSKEEWTRLHQIAYPDQKAPA